MALPPGLSYLVSHTFSQAVCTYLSSLMSVCVILLMKCVRVCCGAARRVQTGP